MKPATRKNLRLGCGEPLNGSRTTAGPKRPDGGRLVKPQKGGSKGQAQRRKDGEER